MKKYRWFILAIVVLILAAGILFYPQIRSRLDWRLELASSYVEMALDPAGEIPTPLPTQVPSQGPSPTPNQIATSTASPIPQEPTIMESQEVFTPTAIPAEMLLPSPEWEAQDWNNCGPAALAMYLRFYGWEGDQFDISDLIKPVRTDRNVKISEMDYYIRTNAGWLRSVIRVGGNIEILKQLIAAGIPVLIEKGEVQGDDYWPGDDNWFAHYLLLNGYSDSRGAFLSQDSFAHADKWINYQELEEYWQPFNRIYYVVYLEQQEEMLASILGEEWDETLNRENALAEAQQEILADQTDAFAWFNLGTNYLYFERYEEAAEAYDMARILGLPQRFLRYQFGPFSAYFNTNRIDELLALTEFVLDLPGESEEALLWRGWAYFLQGDNVQAADYFQQAYWQNPNSIDVNYALDYLGVVPGPAPEE